MPTGDFDPTCGANYGTGRCYNPNCRTHGIIPYLTTTPTPEDMAKELVRGYNGGWHIDVLEMKIAEALASTATEVHNHTEHIRAAFKPPTFAIWEMLAKTMLHEWNKARQTGTAEKMWGDEAVRSEFMNLSRVARDVIGDQLQGALKAIDDSVKQKTTLDESAKYKVTFRTSNKSCPCAYGKPCDPRCTCVNPSSSIGCSRCCSYGSEEQRKEAAGRLIYMEREMSNEDD